MLHRKQSPTYAAGQAIVEFALASTIILFLLSAAVDLGLIFFTMQALNNAAQEGAAFGARHLATTDQGVLLVNQNEIRNRVRLESGSGGGIGYVNLLDLNNNDQEDISRDADGPQRLGREPDYVEQDGGEDVVEKYITIDLLIDKNADGKADNIDAGCLQQPPGSPRVPCFLRVTVRYEYHLVFPFAPAFGDKITLSASHTERVSEAFRQLGAGQPPIIQSATPTLTHTPGPSPTRTLSPTAGASPTGTPGSSPTRTATNTGTPPTSTPTVATPTPTGTNTVTGTPPTPTSTRTGTPPTATRTPSITRTPTRTRTPTLTRTPSPTPALYIAIIVPDSDGKEVKTLDDTRFRAIAYNRSDSNYKGEGEISDGAGISLVSFDITNPDGESVKFSTDKTKRYCVFGGDGSCDPVGNDDAASALFDRPGTYTLRAQAQAVGGMRTAWVVRKFTIPSLDNIVVNITNNSATPIPDGTVITKIDDTKFRAVAYDKDQGTSDGKGIGQVEFEIRYNDGSRFMAPKADSGKPYCFFEGSCNQMDSTNFARMVEGTYKLRARAKPSNGFLWSAWAEVSIVIPPVNVYLAFTNPITAGTVISGVDTTRFEAFACSPASDPGCVPGSEGTASLNGKGIAKVQFQMVSPNNILILTPVDDTSKPYCPFGGSPCARMTDSMYAFLRTQPGTWRLMARAQVTGQNRWSEWVTMTFFTISPYTPTPTRTPYQTQRPSSTLLPTNTRAPTRTPTLTRTPTNTRTPTSTVTPTL